MRQRADRVMETNAKVASRSAQRIRFQLHGASASERHVCLQTGVGQRRRCAPRSKVHQRDLAVGRCQSSQIGRVARCNHGSIKLERGGNDEGVDRVLR